MYFYLCQSIYSLFLIIITYFSCDCNFFICYISIYIYIYLQIYVYVTIIKIVTLLLLRSLVLVFFFFFFFFFLNIIVYFFFFFFFFFFFSSLFSLLTCNLFHSVDLRVLPPKTSGGNSRIVVKISDGRHLAHGS